MKPKTISFLSDNRQIIYSALLLVVIPGAIVLNTWLFTLLFKQTIDQSLTNKAIAVGAAINTALIDKLTDRQALQDYSLEFARQDSDIREISIYWPKDEGFELVAGSGGQNLGEVKNLTTYLVAWSKDFPSAQVIMEPSGKLGKFNRYWLVARPLKDTEGKKQALLVVRVGADIVDQLMAAALTRSYWLLLATLMVVILVLFANSRLFEYAILYRKIKELDKMKDEFISMASHELKTPITVIQGYADLILKDKTGQLSVSPKAKDCLLMMNSSAERLRLLIEDLLNVSRIEQGRLQIDLKPIAPWLIIQQVVSELSITAQEKQLELKSECETDQALKIMLDEGRFKQVLINLIGNAIKYTEKGSVKITMRQKNSDTLSIEIKDTGIGMSAKDRERLFEKFYRIRNDQTAKIGGTGLGLWISRQIISLMDGTVTVDSIERVGSQFTLEFPLKKST